MTQFDNLIQEALDKNGRDLSTIQAKLKEVVEEAAQFVEKSCCFGTHCRPISEFVANFVRKNMIKSKDGSILGPQKDINGLFELATVAGHGSKIEELEKIVKFFSYTALQDNLCDPLNKFKVKYVEIYKGIKNLPKIQRIAAKLQKL